MPGGNPDWVKAFRLFSETGYHVTSSHIRMKDETILLGIEVFEAFMRLSRAIEQAKKMDEVVFSSEEYVSNWLSKIPTWMMNYRKGQEQGQAKIFESVLTAVQSFKDQQAMRVLVIGSGAPSQGLSYPAIAEVLTDRGCAGEIVLTDPLNEARSVIVRDFKLTYESTTKLPEGKFDVVLDDSFPPTLTGKQIEKMVRQGAIVSTKSHLDKIAWNNEPSVSFRYIAGVGIRICSQPYYSLKEVRAIYGFKKPVRQYCSNQCHCSDCWKVRDRGRTDLEWYELAKMGIRPCFPYPGKNYVREMYVAMSDDLMTAEFMWHKISENHQKHFHEFLAFYKRNNDYYCRGIEHGDDKSEKHRAKTNQRRLYGFFLCKEGERREEITTQVMPLVTPVQRDAFEIAQTLPGLIVERKGFLFRVLQRPLGQQDRGKGHSRYAVVRERNKPGMQQGIEENPGPPRVWFIPEDIDASFSGQLQEGASLGETVQLSVMGRLSLRQDLEIPELMPDLENAQEEDGQDFEVNPVVFFGDDLLVPFDLNQEIRDENRSVMLLQSYMGSNGVETGELLDHESVMCMCRVCNQNRRENHGFDCHCRVCDEMNRRYDQIQMPVMTGHEDDCECEQCEQLVADLEIVDAQLQALGYHQIHCICQLCFNEQDLEFDFDGTDQY